MDSFGIGISGLDAAQKAFEVIGNNIANAATDGFHRQRINLSPTYAAQVGTVLMGGGVDIAGITRIIDGLLQKEMFTQESSLGQVSKELTTLRMVESAFGELSGRTGLSTSIDEFFNAMQDLSAHPMEAIWQNQALTAAETMTGQFRTMGDFLTTLESQVKLEAENAITEVNALVARIADLNDSIKRHEISGGQANNLRDQRDQCITQLAKLIGVETQSREHGVVDVSVSGIPVVTSTSAFELEVGLKEDMGIGIGVAGESNYTINVEGGLLGALMTLKNDSLADIHSDLDKLAAAIIKEVNEYHVQGVGSEGSFTRLVGWPMSSETLADFDPPVTDGNIYIRVTNTSTGEVTRTAVPVDASSDTLTTIATAIDAITGLTASYSDSRLNIQADVNYEFDFLPSVLPSPTVTDFTEINPPVVSVSGIYTGTTNQTFTFTVSGTNSVGNGSLQLTVTDADGDTVTSLNIGSGYAAGDKLDLGNGIKIALRNGDLAAGNTFEVDAFANTDTTGILPATNTNAFLTDSDFIGTMDPPVVSVSGIYTGTPNQTFTFTVSGTDLVGNGSLQLTVTDGDGHTVTNLNIGSGYVAGDKLNIGNGIEISLSDGDLVDSNTFEVDAFANTNITSILAATGMNVFLTGSDASDIAVHESIVSSPGRLATSLGADMTDNTNALRMEGLRDTAITSLGSMTPAEFYRRLTADIGQQVAVKQIHEDNIEAMVQSIANQQDEVSGVDINDEAAQLLVFEQMFKAMAKYLSTIQASLQAVMEII